MAVDNIRMEWTNEFKGVLIAPNGQVEIGEDHLKPYNLLLGALGACYYSTFLSIVAKKRLTFLNATMELKGTKRETVPTTLEYVQVKMVIKGANDEEKFRKSAQLASTYCSVYATISQVANIELVIEFEN